MLAPSDRKARIGGFGISDIDFNGAQRAVHAALQTGRSIGMVFANAHFVTVCQPLRERLDEHPAMIILNDGIGVGLATYLVDGQRFRENMNGTDFVPRLLAESPWDLRVYLLGASEAAVAGAAETFGQFPHVEIVGARDGYTFWQDEAATIAAINAAKPDILLVALGCPTQEAWIADNFKHLDVPVTMGVGALFDFMSKRSRRAPAALRRFGLEWVYRLAREPRRLGYRYTIELFSFVKLVALYALREADRRPVRGVSPTR